MTQTINITAGEGEQAETVNLAGIPADIWERFKASAAAQFPSSGELGWATYLSEVIIAAGGGDGTNVSYFMTKVPRSYAEAIERHLAQIGFNWTEFHSQLLRTASVPGQLRLANFRGSGDHGVAIITGINPDVFTKIEETTNKSFEIVLATIIASGGAGALTFAEGTTFLEPVASE